MSALPSWAIVSPKRKEHIERVATLVSSWADTLQLDPAQRGRWERAAWLHDALRDAPHEQLIVYPDDRGWPAKLWHGSAAARRAEEEGEADQGVVNAVRYHSLGHAGWDEVGRALYCADYLEPGRRFDREDRAALAIGFPRDPGAVLRAVASRRIGRALEGGYPILMPTWQFWNSLVSA